jgi:hypothetical protein
MGLSPSTVIQLTCRIESALGRIRPDLRGLSVLTEAASGPFIATPILAAMAGAERVVACTRDSRWGNAQAVALMVETISRHLDLADRIEVVTRPPAEVAEGIDVVTNLGFVRPIDRAVIAALSDTSCIALMWEPWEFRPEDIDIEACEAFGVPVVATNERHPEVGTFRFLGLLALKLLLECDVEVAGLSIAVIGSEPFHEACRDVLVANGARVTVLDPTWGWPTDTAVATLETADAVVVVEHRTAIELLGRGTHALVNVIARRALPLVHICGNLDAAYTTEAGIRRHPSTPARPGFMTVTTSHVGLKPVIDLHAAGLHVAGLVCKARQQGLSADEGLEIAVASGFGLRLGSPGGST